MALPLWLLVLLYLGGLSLVLYAANLLVKVCIYITQRWGVGSLELGSTVVAMATSLPEFTIALVATLAGKYDLAVGNILGANILNIGLVLGVSATLNPIEVGDTARRRELPIALAVLVVFLAVAFNRRVGRAEGAFMLALMGGYLWLHLKTAVGDVRAHRAARPDGEAAPAAGAAVLKTAVAIAMLFAGGVVVVVAASGLADALGVSQLTIGVVLVALSTTVPEMAASASSSYHKQPEISLANVVGSNNFNILVCVGFAALVSPMAVNPAAFRLEFPAAFVFYLILLFLFLASRRQLGRREGLFLIGCYVAFLASLIFLR